MYHTKDEVAMYHYSKKKTEELKLQLYYHAYKACLNEVTTVDDMP